MEISNANTFTLDNTQTVSIDNSISHQNLKEVWTKELFKNRNIGGQKKGYLKASLSLDIKPLKTTWASKKIEDEIIEDEEEEQMNETEIKVEVATKETVTSPTPSTPDKEIASPSHYARRPMNAFLIFCKKHRPIVRQRFPHLENRGVTRILGEWWALLEIHEKSCYTSLAKEYKDAFFSANPDFKWYKLPAPPLRTLNTRPINLHKITSPLGSPTLLITPITPEFTPGKLADETQLGNLTSLMKTNLSNNVSKSNGPCEMDDSTSTNAFVNNNNVENNSEQHKQLLTTPLFPGAVVSLPPKPIKKRKFEFSSSSSDNDNKKVARNIFDVASNELMMELDQNDNSYLEHRLHSPEDGTNGFPNEDPGNMTQQELMNKVVDSMFPDKMATPEEEEDKNDWGDVKEKSKETRKSGRLCKGKRYAEFMMEGKLLGNKHFKKFTQYKMDVNNKFDNAFNNKIENLMHNNKTDTPKLDLSDTIKRLAERTNTKLEDICCKDTPEGVLAHKSEKRKRTESEQSDDSLVKLQSDFNLDLRISELPSLSYEMFLQRKKESKKRKSIRSKSELSITDTKVSKLSNSEGNSLVGSKKRKNKNSIIRLEKPPDANYMNTFNCDLLALATLAEVAANTEKIN